MKRSVLCCFIFCISVFTVKSQNYAALDNVSAISSFSSSPSTPLFIKDTLQGGIFSVYTGNDPVDNGMIFKDALNRKWLRQTPDETVNVQWYGARAAESMKDKANDLYPKLMAALNYVWQHKNFSTVRIPQDKRFSGAYICFATVVLNRPVNIIGDGVNTVPFTKIVFPANTKGFTTAFVTPEGSRNAIKFNNLWLDGNTTGNFDSAAHMISAKGFIEVSHCIIENTGGNGIFLEACSEKTSPHYGSVDGSVIEDVEFARCNNGIYLNGCDANIVKMKRNF